MNEPRSAPATASQTAGPFFHLGLSPQPIEMTTSSADERIRLRVTVTDGDGRAVDDAVIEIWQQTADGTASFARLPTGPDGTCEIDTVRPVADQQAADQVQAPHINLCVLARGLLRHLHTRVYFAGDAALEIDPVLALVAPERRGTLIASPDATQAGRWLFDLRLQGPGETVFFDV